jgi:Fe2+ transport system protein FeoA
LEFINAKDIHVVQLVFLQQSEELQLEYRLEHLGRFRGSTVQVEKKKKKKVDRHFNFWE